MSLNTNATRTALPITSVRTSRTNLWGQPDDTYCVTANVGGYPHATLPVDTLTKAKRHAGLLRGINRRIASGTVTKDDMHLASHLLVKGAYWA